MASEELQVVRDLLGSADLSHMTIAERRVAMSSGVSAPPAGTTVEPANAGGVPAEWLVPAGVSADRVLVYFHGGAYQLGSPATLRHLVGLLATGARARSLSVDYRLAPEHPFPAAVEDAVTAYRWLLAGGTNPAHVAFAGDSAGGGLSLAALVALRDAGDALPAAAAVMSPWTDLALTGESLRTRAAVDVLLKPDGIQETADVYLAGQDPRHPYASPLYADLTGLPPLLIHVGDAEVILDDSVRLAARARAAGVAVELAVWEEMPHVWHAFAGLLPEADRAVEQLAVWLRDHL
jgi:monoterpene epsilon-lactone hydrolase